MFKGWIKRMDQKSHQMGEMMERLEVDPLELGRSLRGADYARAARRCMHCRAEDTCANWLQGPPDGSDPTFCPNFEAFKVKGGKVRAG